MKSNAIAIVETLRQAGHAAYFVGGSVRDMLRGIEPEDFDIGTTATPGQVQQLFPHTVPVGAQFGVILVIDDGHQFQVATFRRDEGYTDGRHPTSVSFGSPEEDAQRRDFTINGLFYDPVADTIIDYVGGRADIERRLVRTIGEPRLRFGEDKLRLLRCIRFAANLDYQIDAATFEAVKEMAPQIRIVSAERVRDELIKIFTGPHADRGLELLDDSGLLAVILPEVAAMKGVEQPPQFHPEGDVLTHVKLMFRELSQTLGSPNCPTVDRTVLAFAVLLHDIGKPPTFQRAPDRIRFNEHDRIGATMAADILRRLHFSNDVMARVVTCVAEHMHLRHVTEMRPAKLKRVLGRETIREEMELHRLDCQSSHGNLQNYDFLQQKSRELPPEIIRPPRLVTGRDLLEMGYDAGPMLGSMLNELEELQLDERLQTRDEALDYARKRLRESTGKQGAVM